MFLIYMNIPVRFYISSLSTLHTSIICLCFYLQFFLHLFTQTPNCWQANVLKFMLHNKGMTFLDKVYEILVKVKHPVYCRFLVYVSNYFM